MSESGSMQDPAGKTRIVLVDDYPLLHEPLKNVLTEHPNFEVVGETDNSEEAIRLVSELVPDILVMDIGMPNFDGLELTRQIKERFPQVTILLTTLHTEAENVLDILKAGAGGCLIKSEYGDDLVLAMRCLQAGNMVLSLPLSRQIIRYASRHIGKPLNLGSGEKLTTRELEALIMVAKGISNKDIAEKLGLSLRTVKSYLTDIFLKLDVASRTEAVIIALRRGILTIDDLD